MPSKNNIEICNNLLVNLTAFRQKCMTGPFLAQTALTAKSLQTIKEPFNSCSVSGATLMAETDKRR
jgi:hypothetical protein